MLTKMSRLVTAFRDPAEREVVRLQILRRIGAWVAPGYRFQWPQLDWWRDADFNAYLARFGELDGLNTGRRWTLLQLTRLAAAVDGDTAECGAYRGAGSFLICAAISGQGRRHLVFDSFEGLSAPDVVDGAGWAQGNMACGMEDVRASLSAFSNVDLYKGWIPRAFAPAENRRFAFVHIDVDLYQPTRDSLRFFYPRMNLGGIIVCDDYGFATCPGATRAVDEVLGDAQEKMINLPFGGGFLIKGCTTAPAPTALPR